MRQSFMVGCLLFATIFCPLVGTASPQAPTARESPKTSKSLPTAEDWYDSSVSLLKQGQQFNRAATQLRKAIALQEQTQYHVALGCALASRAASLAQATDDRQQFAIDQAKYQEWLKAWDVAQKDQNSPDFGRPRPKPPTLLTKDDGLPFVMTREEALLQFRTLSENALAEWETASSLAKKTQDRAEIDYVCGWGRELLRVYGNIANWKDLPDATENIRLLLEATTLAPKNPLYWQSLGDMRIDLSANLIGAKEKPAALLAYRQALKLKKTNANLCYRIYDLCKQVDREQAQEAIRQAAQTDSDNAYPAYRLAGLLFYETPFGDYSKEITRLARDRSPTHEDRLPAIGNRILASPDYAQTRRMGESALALVEQGNRATHYMPPIYAPPFPALLKAAWGLRDARYYFDNTTDIRDWHTISVSVGGYIRVMVQQGDKEAAVHAAHVLIEMGAKITGDLYERPLPLPMGERYRLSNGLSIARTGYGWLVEAYQAVGDQVSAAEFKPEYQAFLTLQAQYWEADKKARQNSYGEF